MHRKIAQNKLIEEQRQAKDIEKLREVEPCKNCLCIICLMSFQDMDILK
jgi:hypothetical protein